MIRCVVFDLDGVLFDSREWHQATFLRALQEVHPIPDITPAYHWTYLDGLSTKQKLKLLTQSHSLPGNTIQDISTRKQTYTEELLKERLIPSVKHQEICAWIKARNYRLLCVSNSIFKTTITALNKLGILDYFDGVSSNEDAAYPKPSPELYMRACLREHISPHEVLILEDSNHGRTAAYSSGSHVLPIVDSTDVTLEKLQAGLMNISRGLTPEPYERRVNIVVPMAGYGSRFAKVGYKDPKPFIPVLGKPMIQWVIENMLPCKETYGPKTLPYYIKPVFHFVAQAQHLEKYSLGDICNSLGVEFTVTTVSAVTEGSACSILLTEQYINNDDPMVSVNSDQWLEWNATEYYRSLMNPTYDGCISTFYQPDPTDTKWSYASLDTTSNHVDRVIEKEVISTWATTGIYGWKRGADYVRYAKQMIAKGIRVNGEFYTAPVYNEAISDGKIIRTIPCRKLWGLGVPDDLEVFLKSQHCEH